MKKYIKICGILIAAFIASFPLFKMLPKGLSIYIISNAIAIGILNYKSVASIVEMAKRCNHPDIEELKTAIYTNAFHPDPQEMPKVLIEEVKLYGILRKLCYLDAAIVLIIAALFLRG